MPSGELEGFNTFDHVKFSLFLLSEKETFPGLVNISWAPKTGPLRVIPTDKEQGSTLEQQRDS